MILMLPKHIFFQKVEILLGRQSSNSCVKKYQVSWVLCRTPMVMFLRPTMTSSSGLQQTPDAIDPDTKRSQTSCQRSTWQDVFKVIRLTSTSLNYAKGNWTESTSRLCYKWTKSKTRMLGAWNLNWRYISPINYNKWFEHIWWLSAVINKNI